MELEREEDRPQDLLFSLPIELLIKVLRDQDLPILTLAECRVVCKKWKAIIDGTELRNKIWNKSVLMYYDESIDNTAYFCFSHIWIRRSITFGPKYVVAADGGLLCFNDLLSTEYVMYNPVEDKFLTLNVPHEIDGVSTVFDGMLECIVVGLVVDQSTKHFKLVLGGVLVPDRSRSLIYDSTTSTWVTIKALLIFDLREESWNVLAEEVMEDKPGALQIVAYEGCVCLLAMDWTDVEFDHRSYDGNLLRHPMVRRIDGSLISRTRDLWVMEGGRAFKIYASGGSDVFFVFEEEGEDLEVAKYWAEIDMMFFLPEPPFRATHEFHLWGFLPRVFHDPWCAVIPAPGVNAEQDWITQQQRHL
ncbi:hypothetical protein AXG93_4601s1420 [Marchantia polymorpha subsp. ruderalis]|uniref:F-box domain-containing protein n=1 Tax=Marchantia polymorpha subsp. ruderalis TaxID=1480154 RepID=A0A176W0L1_MARPO|nr:hypothetical protein AXG93_4601s1420 [Marchantia polymorpha subsp. ruderalis]